MAIFLLIMFIWTSDWKEMVSQLSGAKYQYIIPGLAIYFVGLWLRALRWKFLLIPISHIPHGKLFPIVIIGYMANNILPFRMGEFVRSYYLNLKLNVSPSTGLSTIVVERLLDSLTLLILIGYSSMFLPFGKALSYFSTTLKIHPNVLIGMTVMPFLFLFSILIIMAFSRRRMEAFLFAMNNALPSKIKSPVITIASNALDGLKSLGSWKTIGRTLCLSVPIWISEASLFHFVSLSLGINNAFPSVYTSLMASILVTGITNIGSSIPAAPGGLGLFEWISRETLMLISNSSVSRAKASAFAAITHLCLLLPIVILGQILLWVDGITLSKAIQDNK